MSKMKRFPFLSIDKKTIFMVEIRTSKEEMKISIEESVNDNSSQPVLYEATYVLESLKYIKPIFAVFFHTNEILEHIVFSLKNKKIDIFKDQGKLYFLFYLFNKAKTDFVLLPKVEAPAKPQVALSKLKDIKDENGNTKLHENYLKLVQSLRVAVDTFKKLRKKNSKLKNIMNSLKKYSPLRIVKTIKNQYPMFSLCIIRDQRLASGSTDENIRLYNLETSECELVLYGHSDAIVSLSSLRSCGDLISSSRDNTLKIWEVRSNFYRCVKTLVSHTSKVWKGIQLEKDLFASCSKDRTIKIWQGTPPFNCLHTLVGHLGSVKTILELKGKDTIVSGSFTCATLRFWSTITFRCQYIIRGIRCYSMNSLLELGNNRLIVGEGDSITIINILTFQIETKIKDIFKCVISFLLIDNEIALCGCEDGLICTLDISSLEWISKKKMHEKGVSCLVSLPNGKIASGSVDSLINIYN